ncbi:MAG: helix-turn-helix domain-containing protein [Turicibacter sp.]|nr:helix-turn-helix domain-containing protein [Turicibacter sp.]
MGEVKLKKRLMVLIGQRIKTLRKERGWSREEFCALIEEKVSVRQLGDIERGQALPTHETGYYIAQRLGISYSKLMAIDFLSLAPKYLDLKTRILRLSIYKNPEKIHKESLMLTEIYETYYDNLPETEQTSIDILKALSEVYTVSRLSAAQTILKKHLQLVHLKNTYDDNDLLLIKLYLYYSLEKEDEILLFDHFMVNLLAELPSATGIKAFLIINLIITSLGVLFKKKNYELFISLISEAHEAMNRIEDFQKKPILFMAEGKYWLFGQLNPEKALSFYEQGSFLAKGLGEKFLSDKIMEEWDIDITKYKKK